MTDMNKVRDELAEAHLLELFNSNPDGFTVAPYVNGDVILSAFEKGFDAAIAHLSKQSVAFDKRQAVNAFANARENKDGADSLTTGGILEFQHQQTSLIYEAKLSGLVNAVKNYRKLAPVDGWHFSDCIFLDGEENEDGSIS